jgi:hypothetical protein
MEQLRAIESLLVQIISSIGVKSQIDEIWDLYFDLETRCKSVTELTPHFDNIIKELYECKGALDDMRPAFDNMHHAVHELMV